MLKSIISYYILSVKDCQRLKSLLQIMKVTLQWGISKGSSVIVKSFNEDRMKENLGSFDLKLDDQDFLEIDKLESRKTMRGDFLVNQTTSPYKTLHDLWDEDI